jgi:hypothetical protein
VTHSLTHRIGGLLQGERGRQGTGDSEGAVRSTTLIPGAGRGGVRSVYCLRYGKGIHLYST